MANPILKEYVFGTNDFLQPKEFLGKKQLLF